MFDNQQYEISLRPSPSGALITQQPSQISFNPSIVRQTSQRSQSGLVKSSHHKKRRKFSQMKQNDLASPIEFMRKTKSEQNIETEQDLCNCFSKIRELLKSKQFQIFYVAMLVVFMINCIIESALISHSVDQVTYTIDLALQIFFTLHILIKFVQFQNLSIFWTVIDIATNICGYLAFGLEDFQQPVRYLRAVKTLRLLLLIKEVSFLEIPATKLTTSLSSVGKILFPAVLFVYFYAVIGLYSFRDYEYSKCRDPANLSLSHDWTVYEGQQFLCGQKQCPIVDGIQYECLNPIDYGVQPDPHEVHNLFQGQGLMRYSNIFYSLFSTFKQAFITGTSRLMIMEKQVTNYYYVLIYYFSFIYLIPHIYLGIFYGLLITNEEQSSENKQEEVHLRFSRPKSRRLTNKSNRSNRSNRSKNINDQLEEKGMEGLQPLPGIKKTSSVEQLENIDSASEMINKDSQYLEKVVDLQTTPKNENLMLNNSKGFNGPNKPSRFSKVQQITNRQNEVTGFIIPEETTSQQNLQKYSEIAGKYFIANHVIVILCSINILIDWQGQTDNEKLIFDTIDFCFFWIYMAQIISRFVVHKVYVPNEPFAIIYKIDVLLLFVCSCGVAYEAATATSARHFLMANDNIAKLFRTVKYLRIFLLLSQTPYFKEARIIFRSTLQAVYSIRYLSALWLLVLIISSIMGVHMFQGKTKVNEEEHLDLQHGHPLHIAFQGIVDSLIFTVFVFFNEEWDLLLFEQYISQQVWIVIWVLIILVIGLQILSKYFMTLLMKQLGDRLNQVDQMNEQNQQEQFQEISQMRQSNAFQIAANNHNTVTPINQMSQSIKLKESELRRKKAKKASQIKEIILRESNQENHSEKSSQIQKATNKITNEFFEKRPGVSEKQQGISWILQWRMKLIMALKSSFYKIVKVFVIIVSVVCTLTMNPMNDPNSTRIIVFTKIWYVTVAFFGLQILVSILAFGPFSAKQGYFRSIMNWIYVLVFVIEIVSAVPGLSDAGHIQAILSFRILRIFVLIEIKYDTDSDMRLTMVGFWRLLPKILSLLGIMVIIYSFFAIILVKLYKDDYYYCEGYQEQATIETNIDCMNWGGSWIQRRMNVSNIFSALLFFFFVATSEGWTEQVVESASLSGPGRQPQYGKTQWIEYYFSIFFFLGNMIMLNVFIGLTVYTFQKIKSQVTGLTRLSKGDKMWFSIKNTIHRLSPKMKDIPPDNPLSQQVHHFKNSLAYKVINVILFLIFIISMSLYMTNMAKEEQLILDIILDIFIGIFIFEYIVSWVALGKRVIKQKKFIFESVGIVYFIIVFGISYGTHLDPKVNRMLHGVVICLMGIRYFALLNEVEFVRKMVNSLLSVFPHTYNVFLLMFVTILAYGVIGVYWFGYVKIGPQLNEFDQNFTDLQSAIYALLKLSTLQVPMLQIIDATAGMEPNSVCFNLYSYQDFQQHGRMGCGNPIAAYIFFISFHIIYSLVLFSTLLAIIVDTYAEVRREEESMVNKFQLEAVQKQWENYDPEAIGYIGYRDFWMFTAQLVKIYQVNEGELMSHQTKQSFLKSLEIPIYEDENGVLSFQFHQVVEALTRIVVKQKMGPQWNTKQADKVFKKHHHHDSTGKKFKKSVYDSSHVLTLIVMKSGLKAWKRKAVNTQNQQNLQNLFAFAKKDKKENGTEKNFNPIQNVAKNSKQSSRQLNPQPSQASKPVIETITFEKSKNQEEKFVVQTKELFENKRAKSPRMNIQKPEKKENRITSSATYSQLRSPRNDVRKVQSDRQRQNLQFLTKRTGEQQDIMDQLEEIK